jgi:hypothetical protein
VSRYAYALGTLAVLLATACGGATSTNSGLKDVLLTAARVTSSQSFRADVTLSETFGATGQAPPEFNALSGQTLSLAMYLAVQNAQRSTADVTTTVAGRYFDVLAVLIDGTVYVSSNGGATYQCVPAAGRISSQYGPGSALQYLESVATVTATGPGVVDGASAERYHADLDASKITATIKSAVSALKSPLLAQADSLSFSGGHLDAAVAHTGRIVSDSGVVDSSMDLGALAAGSIGSKVTTHEAFEAHFPDSGASSTVSRPANVAGTAALP